MRNPFQLVFGGGRALSRAHRLIRRMSQDIDLKIVSTGKYARKSGAPATQSRILSWMPGSNSIRRILLTATPVMEAATPCIDYLYADCRGAGLRPEVQIETELWPLRRPATKLPVISFMAEASKQPPEVPEIACVSLVETVAEKFAALTRRAGDSTLVRHIYDLHAIRAHYDTAEVVDFAKPIMLADAEAYGHQFPAHRDDPIAETLRAVTGMASDPGFARHYTVFLRDMVYEERHEFEAALPTLGAMARRLDAAMRSHEKPGALFGCGGR